MTIGPGKYDDLCTLVREKAGAELAVVIIAGGSRGSGFSVQATDPHLVARRLAPILEDLAKQIRKDMRDG